MSKAFETMKKLALAAGCLVSLAMVNGETGEHEITQTFTSPAGSITAAIAAQASPLGDSYPRIYSVGAISNSSFVPFAKLPQSLYRREYHGTAWFQDIRPRWIDDSFLIFEDEFGIAIADVQNRVILVNHAFTAYEKSPIADRWAAIRFRPMARDQELLSDDFQDTLLGIDPYQVAQRIANATEENFVGQMTSVNPGGIVLAKPQWSADGSTFAVLTWKSGKVEAVQYDTNLKETGRTTVDLYVDREVALSPALNAELEQTAEKILSDPTIFQPITPTPTP
jgi:hypothetical protein